jgi:drug/metabolite transporter (DMT)-like permease
MKLQEHKLNLLKGIFITISAYFFFAISSAFVRTLKNVPTIEIVFFQMFIPLLCIIPLIAINGLHKLKTKIFHIHLIRDIVGLVYYFFYFLAIKRIDLIDATVLAFTSPFYIPIICRIWLKEKMQKEIWWAVFIGFMGIVLILKPGTEIFHLGSIVGIFSGIMSALALTTISVLNRKEERLLSTLFYFFLLSSILSFPLLIFYWKTPTFLEFLLLLGVGITSFFAQMLLTKAYKYGTASFLSPLSYSIIIFTSLLSWIFFKLPPGWISFIGIILIIFGGSLTFILKKEPKTVLEVFEKNNEIVKKKRFWEFWK